MFKLVLKKLLQKDGAALPAAMAALVLSCSDKAEADSPEPRIIHASALGHCSYNKIHASSDGRFVAISDIEETFGEARAFNSPSGFLVFDLLDEARPTDEGPKEAYIFAPPAKNNPPRLIPLGWNEQGLFFRIGNGTLGQAEFNSETGPWAIETQALPNVWRRFGVELIGQADIGMLDDTSVKLRARGLEQSEDLRRRTAYLSAEGVQFTAIDMSEGQALLYGPNIHDMIDLGHANFFWRFTPGFGPGGITTFSLGHAEKPTNPGSGEKYALPLLDEKSGTVVGSFSPNAISGAVNNGLNLTLEAGDYLIRDAAYLADTVHVLAENSQAIRVFTTDAAGQQTQQFTVCRKSAAQAGFAQLGMDELPTSTEPNYRYRPTSIGIQLKKGAPTTGALFQSENSTGRDLVVYFHGGPASSVYGTQPPVAISPLMTEGYDILSVEYSGSVGGGLRLSRSLATKPQFGFSSDANAIRHWIKANEYSNVRLYAVSFGAAPAMVFQQSSPDLVRRSAYLGPLLEMPETGVSETADGRFFEAESGSQIQFEIGVFGGAARRDEFVAWLRENAAAFEASGDDLFVFGELDKKTPVDNAPPNISERANMLIVPRTTHQFLGSGENTKRIIVDHLLSN